VPDTLAAFASLEQAQALLLAAPRRAPQLALDVAAALEDQAPEFVLEALTSTLSALFPPPGPAAPPPQHSTRLLRARALRVLRRLLWTVGPSGMLSPRLGARRGDFSAAAARLLTAAELASVYLARLPAEAGQAPRGGQLIACTAAIAAGFTRRDVELVRVARDALVRLPPPSSRGQGPRAADEGGESAESGEPSNEEDEDEDASVPLCVARLLLGDAEGALQALDGHKEASDFVTANSGEGDGGPLPGLVALAQAWLAASALPRFPDTAAAGPLGAAGLSAWFDSPGVRAALESAASAPRRAAAQLAQLVRSAATRFAEDEAGAPPDYRTAGLLRPFAGKSLRRAPDELSALPSHPLARPARFLATLSLSSALLALALAGPASRLPPLPQPLASGAARLAAAARSSLQLLAGAAEGVAERAAGVGSSAAMDERLASAVVRRWQRVKAAALGGQHDVRGLARVLEGGMLRQWAARAEDVRNNDFYWEVRRTRKLLAPCGVQVWFDSSLTRSPGSTCWSRSPLTGSPWRPRATPPLWM